MERGGEEEFEVKISFNIIYIYTSTCVCTYGYVCAKRTGEAMGHKMLLLGPSSSPVSPESRSTISLDVYT